MRRRILRTQSDVEWLLDEFGFEWIFQVLERRSEKERAQFRLLFLQRILDAHSPQEVVQKVLGDSSALEVAQKVLGASSALEVAQKVLDADSAVDAALKLLPTASERREFLKRWQQEENVAVE